MPKHARMHLLRGSGLARESTLPADTPFPAIPQLNRRNAIGCPTAPETLD